MRKSTKIMLVVAGAILLCAFLLLGALLLEDNGLGKQDQKPGDKEPAVESDRGDENGHGAGDATAAEPAEQPTSPETDPAAPLTIEIRSIDAGAYPTLEIYCEIRYEAGGDFAAGLPLDLFHVREVAGDGGCELACELLSAAQLTAAASPTGGDCYLLTCTAGGLALEGGVELVVEAVSARYEGLGSAPLTQIVPADAPKPDSSYQALKADVTWEEAAALCEAEGGHLVSIDSAAEYEQVIALAEAAELKVFWAGARIERIGDGWENACWLTGAPLDFTDWYPGEPNHETDGELYLMIFCVDGVWAYNDAPNDANQYYTGRIGYICEFEN